jgi:hypothetical protein
MPTVLRELGYRFFFYADDRSEPRHVHVQREMCTAKFWLEIEDMSFVAISVICVLTSMNSLAIKQIEARATSVRVSDNSLVVDLTDGRTVSAPLAWYPRLL